MKHKSQYIHPSFYIVIAVLIILLMTGCEMACRRWLPPSSGTIFCMGSHPMYYGGVNVPIVYFLAIQSDSNPNLSWTWYVDEATFNKFEVGDQITRLATVQKKGATP